MAATIYVRAVPDELDAWLAQRSNDLGVSKAALVRMILNTAKTESWPFGDDSRFTTEEGQPAK